MFRPCGLLLVAMRAESGHCPCDQQGMAVQAWAHGNVPPNLPQAPLPARPGGTHRTMAAVASASPGGTLCREQLLRSSLGRGSG